ncbi:MAG: alkaline phosphatase PafA [Leadbetterella sp.]
MYKKIIPLFILFCFQVSAQTNSSKLDRPKLVVGIIVDQMRYDFLYRYYNKYSEGGFKRLMNQGFNCKNNQYHYASTVTGPGHAHIFNGSSPSISGIVGNDWYEKSIEKSVYVAFDTLQSIVGEGAPSSGRMSPVNMKVTSICDQMRIATQFRSKTIGIAIKDRGAIMPVGHTGEAYWLDTGTGNWVTSTYYKKELPSWVQNFNNLKLKNKYAMQKWETLLPISNYIESEGDDQKYENNMVGEASPVFPHKSSITMSYFGNEITTDFALEALKNENLGKDENTDFLTISYSSPDYAGHSFGPQSVELEDIYLRLDKNIEQLLRKLDEWVGRDQYSLFLTADHGVAEIPGYLKKNNIPAGIFLGGEINKKSESVLQSVYGDGTYIKNQNNYQFYLNHKTLLDKKVSEKQVFQTLRDSLSSIEGIYDIVDLKNAGYDYLPLYLRDKINHLYNPKRSGEILILPEPAWFSGYIKGTTHGTPYSYDTHVPLLFYGKGIRKGNTTNPTFICDIASTLAQLLSIMEPNGNVGKPISEVLKP